VVCSPPCRRLFPVVDIFISSSSFSFLALDPYFINETSGCTAVTLLITKDNHLFCSNAGDSRCVLSSGGVAVPLSYDHKPTNEGELARITGAGGYVQFGRVNGRETLFLARPAFQKKVGKTHFSFLLFFDS